MIPPSVKKLIEKATPVAFRNLPIIEIKRQESKPTATTEVNESLAAGEHEAKLIIETSAHYEEDLNKNDKSMQCDVTTPTQSVKTLVSGSALTGTKSGALDKIRKQYAKSNGAATHADIKPLNSDELQMAWNNFTELLKEGKILQHKALKERH